VFTIEGFTFSLGGVFFKSVAETLAKMEERATGAFLEHYIKQAVAVWKKEYGTQHLGVAGSSNSTTEKAKGTSQTNDGGGGQTNDGGGNYDGVINGGDLAEHVVKDKKKTWAGKALQKVSGFFEKIASSVTLTVTGVVMPFINQTKVWAKEGIHPGRAYNQESNVSWAVPYVVKDWKFVRRDDLMTTGNLTPSQSAEVIQSTTNTLLLIPTISSGPTPSVIFNKGIEQVIKNGVKQGVKYGTNNND
jgi:hypothetical protein